MTQPGVFRDKVIKQHLLNWKRHKLFMAKEGPCKKLYIYKLYIFNKFIYKIHTHIYIWQLESRFSFFSAPEQQRKVNMTSGLKFNEFYIPIWELTFEWMSQNARSAKDFGRD